MLPVKHIRCTLQPLFGLLLVCWPLLDTGPMGAVTPLRLGLGGGMLLLLVAAILTASFQRQPVRWRPTDWAVLACAVWYVCNVIFIGRGETDPYNLLNGFVILAAYIFCRIAGTTFLLPSLLVSGLIQAGIATAQLCGTVATRHAYYDLTGSFPNPGPLGGWLCVALLAAVVLTVRFWKKRCGIWAALCAAGGAYIGVMLLLTDSRAAWLGAAAGIFAMLCTLRFRYKRPVLFSLAALALIGFFFLYGYKKDSADGRLLVWQVSADMIARHPIAGYGVGAFPEHYMFAQADYFGCHPGSRFTAVAEQTSYPFNELIGVTCEQGIIGGVLLLFLIVTALFRSGGMTGQVLLSGLTVFGLFSYPSAFLSFGLLFAALLAGCVKGSSADGRPLSIRKALCVAFLIAASGVSLLLVIRTAETTSRSRYVLLREASELMRRKDLADLPRLERLARRLPVAGFHTDLGDLCLEADSVERAKAYYRTAARMIPSRLRPYDGLFRAYLQTGHTDSATLMARRIVTMPVKVSNTTTIRIRRTAQEWLEADQTGD